MSSGDIYVKTLLWVTAMDSILMAEKAKLFKHRLCKILGPETEVFLGLEVQGVPPYRLDELASEIYVLRNQVAHGGTIIPRFLRPPPVSATRDVNASYPGLFTYANVLHEASIVLLCRLLRHIILQDMLPVFTDLKQWKRLLKAK